MSLAPFPFLFPFPAQMGFSGAACAPMVRSSYWADQQAHSAGVG